MIVTHPEPAIARFRTMITERGTPTGTVDVNAVAIEVRPVVPLLSELSLRGLTRGDLDSFEFRECFTVLTLLGRRLALLDLTPTSTTEIVDMAIDAVAYADGAVWSDELRGRCRAAVVEGFVIGREERVREVERSQARRPVRPLRIDDRAFALAVSGVHDPDDLGEYVDALGRAMLDADADAAIVDLSQLGEPNADRARAVFAADEVARMLGARCVFSGLSPGWRAAAAEARIDLGEAHVVSRFSEALVEARRPANRTPRDREPAWRTAWKRLRRRRPRGPGSD